MNNFKKLFYALSGLAVFAVIVIGVAGAAYYFHEKSGNPSYTVKGNLNTAQDAKDLVAQVSALMLLPTDEVPTIATVTDPEKLSNQPFFVNAKTGDRVLIYSKAGRAILYDPVENKII